MARLQLWLFLFFAGLINPRIILYAEGHRVKCTSQALGPESPSSSLFSSRPRKVLEEQQQFTTDHDADFVEPNDDAVTTATHSQVEFNNTYEAEGLSLKEAERAELDPSIKEKAGTLEEFSSTAHNSELEEHVGAGRLNTGENVVEEKQMETIVNDSEPTSAVQKRGSKKRTRPSEPEDPEPLGSIEQLGTDRTWLRNYSGASSSSEPLERQALHIQYDDDVYNQAVDTIPGIGFLGSGYDLVMGNPLGDEHTPGDPGFRAPVILFDWGHDKEGVSPDLTTLQPKGGYVRPFVSCQHAETVEEVDSLSAYVAELAADASSDGNFPFLPFSGSVNFRVMVEESLRKQTKTFMLRAYCLRYEAGFAAAGMNSSRTTEAFREAVESLPAAFPSTSEGNNCTPEAFRQQSQSVECRDPAILRWMEFFQDFGTHVTTNIKLGGKVTKQIRMTKEQAQALHDRSGRGNASLFKALLSTETEVGSKKDNSRNSFGTATTTFAVGGRAPNDPSDPQELAEWAKSVAALPMPVKYELQPLSRLLPENLLPTYQKAQYFYARAYGLSAEDLHFSAGNTKALPYLLQNSTAVTWAGPAPGFTDCPRGKRILFGFAAYMNLNSPTSPFVMKPCQTGSTRCEGPSMNGSPEADTRIWAVCTDEMVESLETFSFADPTPEVTVGCSDGKEIFFGMQMSFFFNKAGLASLTMAHCSPGGLECRFQNGGPASDQTNSQHLIFAACVARGTPGMQKLFVASSSGIVSSSQAVDASETALTDCGLNASHVTGFALEVHTLMPLVREAMNVCPEGKRYCSLNTFVVPPSADDAKRGNVKSRENKYSSLGFAICALKDFSIADDKQITEARSLSTRSKALLTASDNNLAGANETIGRSGKQQTASKHRPLVNEPQVA
ncbi:hypothetical protein Esti_005691 [Eimeria stiedai]